MRPDQKIRLLDPGRQRQPDDATLPQWQTQMNQHHAEVCGKIVSQMVPSAASMEPNARRILFLSRTICQINFAVFGSRKTLADLEEFTIARVAGKHGILLLRGDVPRLAPRWILRWRSRLPILANVSLERRKTTDLHTTYWEFLACIDMKSVN